MGTKYTATSISGYNSSPPPDDGSTGSDNQVTWAKHKTKLGDPLNTAITSMDSKLVTALDQSARSITGNDSTVASDHNKVIEIASTVSTSVVTLKLADAASMVNDYRVTVVNRSAYGQTIGRVTTANGINGTATNVTIPSLGMLAFAINSGANGYNIIANSLGNLIGNTQIIENNISVDGAATFNSTIVAGGPSVVVGGTPQWQFNGNGVLSGSRSLAVTSFQTGSVRAAYLQLSKSASTTIGTNALVSNDDTIGSIVFAGNDGTEFAEGASITAFVDASPGSGDMPMRLVFSTSPNGTALPAEAFRVTSEQVLSLTSGQLAFPATQNASADANTLDDYEEGTWTAVLSDGTHNATMSDNDGRYVKIGRAATIWADIATSSLVSVSGNLRVTGIPFTQTAGIDAPIAVANGANLAISAGQTVAARVAAGNNFISLQLWDNAAGNTPLLDTEWSSDGSCSFGGTMYASG